MNVVGHSSSNIGSHSQPLYYHTVCFFPQSTTEMILTFLLGWTEHNYWCCSCGFDSETEIFWGFWSGRPHKSRCFNWLKNTMAKLKTEHSSFTFLCLCEHPLLLEKAFVCICPTSKDLVGNLRRCNWVCLPLGLSLAFTRSLTSFSCREIHQPLKRILSLQRNYNGEIDAKKKIKKGKKIIPLYRPWSGLLCAVPLTAITLTT